MNYRHIKLPRKRKKAYNKVLRGANIIPSTEKVLILTDIEKLGIDGALHQLTHLITINQIRNESTNANGND